MGIHVFLEAHRDVCSVRVFHEVGCLFVETHEKSEETQGEHSHAIDRHDTCFVAAGEDLFEIFIDGFLRRSCARVLGESKGSCVSICYLLWSTDRGRFSFRNLEDFEEVCDNVFEVFIDIWNHRTSSALRGAACYYT